MGYAVLGGARCGRGDERFELARLLFDKKLDERDGDDCTCDGDRDGFAHEIRLTLNEIDDWLDVYRGRAITDGLGDDYGVLVGERRQSVIDFKQNFFPTLLPGCTKFAIINTNKYRTWALGKSSLEISKHDG